MCCGSERAVPGRSKRQKQLEAAREAKHCKREAESLQDSHPEEDLEPEQETGQSDDPLTDPSDPNNEENPGDVVEIDELVEEYTRNWVDNLDRDDSMSLSIA